VRSVEPGYLSAVFLEGPCECAAAAEKQMTCGEHFDPECENEAAAVRLVDHTRAVERLSAEIESESLRLKSGE